MKKDYPRYTLRIPKELLDKIGYTAEINGRTKNREIEFTIRRYISDYERLYGKIHLNSDEEQDKA